MKLPDWLRIRSTRREPGRLVVNLSLDTSQFEAAMKSAAATQYEALSRIRYANKIRRERALGRRFVDGLLSDMAAELGLVYGGHCLTTPGCTLTPGCAACVPVGGGDR